MTAVKTTIRELGTYTVAVDTVSPRVTPLNRSQWKSGNIQFKIGDAETGVKDYKVMIDGRFELFQFQLEDSPVVNEVPEAFEKGSAP